MKFTLSACKLISLFSSEDTPQIWCICVTIGWPDCNCPLELGQLRIFQTFVRLCRATSKCISGARPCCLSVTLGGRRKCWGETRQNTQIASTGEAEGHVSRNSEPSTRKRFAPTKSSRKIVLDGAAEKRVKPLQYPCQAWCGAVKTTQLNHKVSMTSLIPIYTWIITYIHTYCIYIRVYTYIPLKCL